MARRPGPLNQSRGNGPAAPASAAATAPGIVDGQKTQSFYDLGGEDEPPESPLAAAFVETVRETSHALDEEGELSADYEVGDAAMFDAAADTDAGPSREELERIRKMRKPIGQYAQKLALPKRRGYHRHWFNDVAGRIDEALANGWAFVKGSDGQPIRRCVGTGRDKGAMFAFAMELPEVFWLEDMQARHADAQAKVDALKKSPFRAEPGTAKAADKGKFYDPSEHEAGPLQVVRAG
jgi:hypothetical protein